MLEWDYKAQEFGPPIEDRLKKEFITELAKEAGFAKSEVIQLTTLVLYKLTV